MARPKGKEMQMDFKVIKSTLFTYPNEVFSIIGIWDSRYLRGMSYLLPVILLYWLMLPDARTHDLTNKKKKYYRGTSLKSVINNRKCNLNVLYDWLILMPSTIVKKLWYWFDAATGTLTLLAFIHDSVLILCIVYKAVSVTHTELMRIRVVVDLHKESWTTSLYPTSNWPAKKLHG